jgi:hypothetical protein
MRKMRMDERDENVYTEAAAVATADTLTAKAEEFISYFSITVILFHPFIYLSPSFIPPLLCTKLLSSPSYSCLYLLFHYGAVLLS